MAGPHLRFCSDVQDGLEGAKAEPGSPSKSTASETRVWVKEVAVRMDRREIPESFRMVI